MTTMRLGVDVACRAAHRASLADEAGNYVWSGRRFHTTPQELEELWGLVPDDAEVTVVMEPTRNAWVPLAAWFQARGAEVVLVPPEQSSDLRDYYSKHTKNDRLDSRILARLPLLHPEGLTTVDSLGPAEPLKRAVRHRRKLVGRRTACFQRIDALVELLGPAWADVLGTGSYGNGEPTGSPMPTAPPSARPPDVISAAGTGASPLLTGVPTVGCAPPNTTRTGRAGAIRSRPAPPPTTSNNLDDVV